MDKSGPLNAGLLGPFGYNSSFLQRALIFLAAVRPAAAHHTAAMAHHLRARALALALLLRSPDHSPFSHAPSSRSLHRLLSSAAAASRVSSRRPFDVEGYLVSACGLSREQATKAAKKISHLKSPSKPDAVLAFLSGTLGVTDVAAVVAKDPSLLCARVEQSLAPRVADLGGRLGLSRDEIVRLLTAAPVIFRNGCLGSNLEFWLKELGSFQNFLHTVKSHAGLLRVNLDKVGKPNVALLKQCVVNVSELAGMSMYSSRLFTLKPEVLLDAVERVEELGMERGAPMFRRLLVLIAFMSKEVVAMKMQNLGKFGFSHDQVLQIIRGAPNVLVSSEQKIQRNVDFLMKDVGLDLPYIARRPTLILFSVDRRLRPRHCLFKILTEKGLVKSLDFCTLVSITERNFLEKFVVPYKDVVLGLANGYASNCSGKVVAWPEEWHRYVGKD